MPPATRSIVLLLLAAALGVPGTGRPQPRAGVSAGAESAYGAAVRLRSRLDATPPASRMTRQYEGVLNAFRAVYHADRADPDADASAEAVAELLAEEGRLFHDPSLLRAAVEQLSFLRRDFSASRYSIPALLTAGEIQFRDLDDRAAAQASFAEFLRDYPHHPLAPQARAELRRLGVDVPSTMATARAPATEAPVRPDVSGDYGVVQAPAAQPKRAAAGPEPTLQRSRQAAVSSGAELPARRSPQTAVSPDAELPTPTAPRVAQPGLREQDIPPSNSTEPSAQGRAAAEISPPASTAPAPAGPVVSSTPAAPMRTVRGVPVFRPAARSRLALVTGVRHWSTANYTRIAIDLEDEVPFEASRVSGPDRIFFDLHGARLAPELTGRAVTVTDGGFLERIRAAQFSGDVVRVVLDVSDVSDYSAFWLPNPSRLIIDIHGRPQGAAPFAVASAAGAAQGAAANAALRAAPAGGTSSPASASPGSNPGTTADAASTADAEANPAASLNSTFPPATTGGGGAAHAVQGDTAAAVRAPARSSTPLEAAPHTAAQRAAANGAPVPSAARAGAPGTFVADTAPPGAPVVPSQPRAGDSLAAIAALSQQPSRVRATRAPTTAPVAAVTAPALKPSPTTSSDEVPATTASTPVPATSRRGKRVPIAPADSLGAAPDDSTAVARAAEPDATGGRSMVRALGLKINRIVVDAGHGGHDSGTLGPGGIEEKDVVLDVALRLGKLLKQRLGADVIYTRDDDTFIPLETRTAIANKAQADLFISVHANSSPDASARGVETYYLNFTSSADALEVAARENAVSDESIHQLSDLVKKITLQDKIAESREFATDVESSLYQGLEGGNPGLKDRGVKKAPFVVLIGANMPSILAEISFLTNPDDAAQLRDGAYRQRIAEALYKGAARYVHSLSGAHLEETAGSR